MYCSHREHKLSGTVDIFKVVCTLTVAYDSTCDKTVAGDGGGPYVLSSF